MKNKILNVQLRLFVYFNH